MVLTERQIERYSRQIIVVGGFAQERLLAGRVAIAGEAADVETPLTYLINAGVGRFTLDVLHDNSGVRDRLASTAREIEADAAPEHDQSQSAVDVELIIIGSGDAVALAASRFAREENRPTVVVRLDNSPKIAIIPPAVSGPSLSRHNLLAAFSSRADSAGFVSMIAAMETLKLAIEAPPSATRVIEFDGYRTAAAVY